MIFDDDEDKIIEFKVMVLPLNPVNLMQVKMRVMLEQMPGT